MSKLCYGYHGDRMGNNWKYSKNAKAWMVTNIFTEKLKKMDKKMKQQNFAKVLLFMD